MVAMKSTTLIKTAALILSFETASANLGDLLGSLNNSSNRSVDDLGASKDSDVLLMGGIELQEFKKQQQMDAIKADKEWIKQKQDLEQRWQKCSTRIQKAKVKIAKVVSRMRALGMKYAATETSVKIDMEPMNTVKSKQLSEYGLDVNKALTTPVTQGKSWSLLGAPLAAGGSSAGNSSGTSSHDGSGLGNHLAQGLASGFSHALGNHMFSKLR